MAAKLQHWNQNHLAVIAAKTTGDDFDFHQIWQFVAILLDGDLKVSKDHKPLILEIAPDNPEYINMDDRRHKRLKEEMFAAMKRGVDPITACDIVVKWRDTLNLPFNKYQNTQGRIRILAYDYATLYPFMIKWLGRLQYADIFDDYYEDLLPAVMYLNTHSAMHGEKLPIAKTSLSYICTALEIPNERPHNALQDALSIAEAYRRLTSMGMFGY